MAHMINLRAPFVVILLSTVLLAGCSVFEPDPQEQANERISAANESIETHNELFTEARNTYEEVKGRIEAGGGEAQGEGNSESTVEQERRRIAEARSTMEEARTDLEDAKNSVDGVQELEVSQPVGEYAGLLSEAMDAQLVAEAREIEFYELLEEDPLLEERRDRAQELLSQASNNYQRAEEAYGQAQELANDNPDVLVPGDSTSEESETAPRPPQETNNQS